MAALSVAVLAAPLAALGVAQAASPAKVSAPVAAKAKPVKIPASVAKAFAAEPGGNGTCDPIGGAVCELPFPNDWYTAPSTTSVTGRQLAYTADTLVKTVDGKTLLPTEVNRNDGFSPGSLLTTMFPGMDLKKSKVAPITDIGSSTA